MTRDTSQWRFETKSVHAGYSPEPTTHAVAVPLYQTVAFRSHCAMPIRVLPKVIN